MKFSPMQAGDPVRRAPRPGWLDHAAILLSGLCVVHCIGTTIAVLLLASVGGLLLDPRVHEVGLMLAIMIGAIALGAGYRAHRSPAPLAIGAVGLALMALGVALPEGGRETIATVLGVSILAFGHLLNRRAHRR